LGKSRRKEFLIRGSDEKGGKKIFGIHRQVKTDFGTLPRLESLRVKNKNSRKTIRNQMVQKTLSLSGMILKIFLALNINTNWAANEHLPRDITKKARKNTDCF